MNIPTPLFKCEGLVSQILGSTSSGGLFLFFIKLFHKTSCNYAGRQSNNSNSKNR